MSFTIGSIETTEEFYNNNNNHDTSNKQTANGQHMFGTW